MPVPNEQTSCEEFQVALEKEAGGVLSEQERTDLADHVSACAECQRMRQLIESLENMSLPATSSRAMNVVRGRVARRKRHVWMLAAYLATVCASTFFFFGPNVGAFSVALSVGAMIAELFMKRRFDRRVADRAQQKDDLFAKMRAETEKQIAYLERNVLWLFLLAIGGLNAHSLWNEASVTSWYGIAVTVVLAGGLLYGQRVRLPRLRRELAELSTENEGADG